MFLFGIEFKDLVTVRSIKEKRVIAIIIDEIIIQIGNQQY